MNAKIKRNNMANKTLFYVIETPDKNIFLIEEKITRRDIFRKTLKQAHSDFELEIAPNKYSISSCKDGCYFSFYLYKIEYGIKQFHNIFFINSCKINIFETKEEALLLYEFKI